jgi:hypothetical protein
MNTSQTIRAHSPSRVLKSLRSIVGFFCALFFLSPVAHGDIWIFDPGVRDTVRIDSVVSNYTGLAAVPIYFFNDEPLGGIEVTITIQSPNIIVDSFSWVGGRASSGGTIRNINIFAPGTLTIVAIPLTDPPIPAGTGLLGRLYVHYAVNIPSETAIIDSVTIIDGVKVYQTSFSDASSSRFIPQFRRGAITIQHTCCVNRRGNVNNDPNDAVNIVDITYLANFFFKQGPAPVCREEANANGDASRSINIVDLTYLVGYLFRGGAQPPLCP